ALAEQGQVEEGIAQMQQSRSPSVLAVLAESYGKVGQEEEGLTLLAAALALVDKTGERVSEAELYRVKGELTLQKFKVQSSRCKVEISWEFGVGSSESEAEECLKKAIEIACKQQAKSLELRAAMSLARLWQQQGKHHEAHNMLSKIYDWFTEG